MSPRVLILRAPGTNCDEESAHAFALAGGVPERWHVNRLLESPAAARRVSNPLPARRLQLWRRHRRRPHPRQPDSSTTWPTCSANSATPASSIIGICNGFQILLKTELLVAEGRRRPAGDARGERIGQVRRPLGAAGGRRGNKCVFLSGIESLELPVAHGEGRFVPRDERVLESLRANGQLVLKYRRSSEPGRTSAIAPFSTSGPRTARLAPPAKHRSPTRQSQRRDRRRRGHLRHHRPRLRPDAPSRTLRRLRRSTPTGPAARNAKSARASHLPECGAVLCVVAPGAGARTSLLARP